MRYWPVKKSFSKDVPEPGEQGSFWENRGDRFHCGVDIYAPATSEVVAIEGGKVIGVGVHTSPYFKKYWNRTLYLLVRSDTGIIYKYAELGRLDINMNQTVVAGQQIGRLGNVLKPEMIGEDSPGYIQNLKDLPSMLHLEIYESDPIEKHEHYLGGNWFRSKKPANLLDPTQLLKELTPEERSILNESMPQEVSSP